MPKKRKRKSPFRHKVRSHTRSSPKGKIIKVGEYWRGKGKPPIRKLKRARNPKGSSPKFFVVKIIYPNKSTERIRVEAKNYFEALEEGLERRRSLDMPLMVDIRG